MALKGLHNAQNTLAVRYVCRALGRERQKLIRALQAAGLPHRLQPAGQIDNILFVNDSKATNGEAAARALARIENIHWCARGIAKEYGLDACIPHLSHVTKSYLFGTCDNDFASSLSGHIPVSCFDTLEEAIEAASLSARQERSCDQQVILLSPAAASFDQYTSYEERGMQFCTLAATQIDKLATLSELSSLGGHRV